MYPGVTDRKCSKWSSGVILILLVLGLACVPSDAGGPRRNSGSTAASEATPSGTGNTGAADAIRLGLLLTNVGPSALFARYEERGARLLIDQVNRAGGISGRPIELVYYDTEGKPDRAAALYRRLANEDRVAAVIGPDSILVVLGMSSVPKEVRTFSVAAPGVYEMIKEDDRDWIVTAWAMGGLPQSLILGYFKQQFGVRRIGFVTTADVIGEHTDRIVREVAQLLGIAVVKTVAQPASDRDLLPSLRELAATQPRPDAVLVFGSGPYGNIALNQTELVGLNVPLGYLGGNIVPELIKDVGPSVAGRVYLVTGRLAVLDSLPAGDPYGGALKRFAADYRAAYSEPPTLPSGIGYDMALPIIEALRAVGPDRARIREHVWNDQDFLGMQGVRFRRKPGNGVGTDPLDAVIATIENEQFVFRGYLKPVYEELGITSVQIAELMRKLRILTQ